MSMDQQIHGYAKHTAHFILSKAKNLRSFLIPQKEQYQRCWLTLNMTVQSLCAGGNPCAVSWTTLARHVLFWLLHAKILHQDLWLPDERARLRTGRAFTRSARLRAGRARVGSRRRTPEYL